MWPSRHLRCADDLEDGDVISFVCLIKRCTVLPFVINNVGKCCKIMNNRVSPSRAALRPLLLRVLAGKLQRLCQRTAGACLKDFYVLWCKSGIVGALRMLYWATRLLFDRGAARCLGAFRHGGETGETLKT